MTDDRVHPLLKRLGLALPILQAPMAGVATPELAAAVSNAGGLGGLGAGASSPEDARRMIEATRVLTDRPFNINVFCHRTPAPDPAGDAAWLHHLAPLYARLDMAPPTRLVEVYPSFMDDDRILGVLLETRPAVVSFHFGLPAPHQLQALKQAGICLLASATNLDEARRIEAAGLDAIIAQGIEAGGHRGCFDPEPGVPLPPDEHLSTAVLVRQLVLNTRLPIIAAGGIMDGHAIRAMQELGAAAAQLGTAFVACPESAANAAYRTRLRSPDAAHTRLTRVLSGRPARGIVSPFIDYGEAPDAPPPAAYPRAYDAAKQLHAAASRQGEHTYAAHWAGQGAPMIREIPAAQLVATLAQEWRTA